MEMERTLESRSVDGATAAISPDRCVIVLDRSAGNLSVALRFGETSPSDNVQCKLHAVRHSQLIKDPQHVVLYRVLAQSKSFGYFAIRAAVRNERDDFLLPFRKEILPFGVDNARGRRPLSPERVQNEAEFVLFDPHLATADDVDRFAERFKWLIAVEYAVGSETERIDDEITVERISEQDRSDSGAVGADTAEHVQSDRLAVAQAGANQGDVGLAIAKRVQHAGRICCARYDFEAITGASQSRRHKLAAHFIGVGKQNRGCAVSVHVFSKVLNSGIQLMRKFAGEGENGY
jgi:hypothetical protein